MQRFHARIVSPGRNPIYITQIQPTERPIEDRYSVDFDQSKKRLLLGVYDGHGGPDTSDYVSRALPARILAHQPETHIEQFQQLDDEMVNAFRKDHSLLHPKSTNWVENARLMKSGSTALVLDINLATLTASYANAGDCRLVVCSLSPERESILFQTEDLNAKIESERRRIASEHPDEDQVIVGDRLFGRLMTTRGFGDGYYKLPRALLTHGPGRNYIDTLSSVERPGKITMSEQYASLFYAYKTPPYITATPQVGSLQLQKGDVVLLASDGLWDVVSSEDAATILLRSFSSETTDDPAEFLFNKVLETKSPGDDVTILVFQV